MSRSTTTARPEAAVATAESNRTLWIDRFVSAEALADRDGDELLRARLTVVVGLTCGVAMCVAIAISEQTPAPWLRVFGALLAIAFFAVPILQPRLRNPRPLREGLLALTGAHALALGITTGGRDLGGILIAVLLPLLAVLMAGSRTAIAWTAILVTAFLGVGLSNALGVEPMLNVDLKLESEWSVIAGAATILVSLGVALTYDHLRRSTLDQLRTARERADRAHEERLRAEARFRAGLEQQVEARTAELLESQEQLRRADRLASIGTLAAGVAHQINNPIGSILISAEFALSQGSESDMDAEAQLEVYRDALADNAASAERCGRIVRNLLAFSRASSSESETVDLNRAVRDALDAEPAPATAWELELASAPLMIQGRPVELEQLVTNLVRNALESGHPDDVGISIRTEMRGDVAILSVIDRGHGIQAEDRDHIFDPFYTTRAQQGGTGLGLSLVHAIAEGHDGDINVLSEPGKGTEFIVTFPILEGGD